MLPPSSGSISTITAAAAAATSCPSSGRQKATMKRPLSSGQADDGPSKRPRVQTRKHHSLQNKQPGAILALANPQDPEVIDSLLDRGLAVGLHAVGFNAVKNDAFESLRGCVEEYMKHFTWRIKQSMESSRRLRPIPQDFDYALRAFNIEKSSLKRDARTKIAPSVTQPAIFPRAPSSSTTKDFASAASAALDRVLANGPAKQSKRYVPPHFPTLPPEHTFKDTAVVTERDSDARRIRERATQEGVLAEQALRKLVAARRPGRQRARLDGDAPRAPHVSRDEQIFKDALAAVLQEDRGKLGLVREDQALFLDGTHEKSKLAEEEVDFGFGAIVNCDRVHWRKGAGTDMLGIA